MPEEDFEAVVEEAKDIEKAAQPYAGFKGKIEVSKDLDLYPREFAEYNPSSRRSSADTLPPLPPLPKGARLTIVIRPLLAVSIPCAEARESIFA